MASSERIHMIAICGTGMAALAGMLKKAGHHISGSDQSIYPPMSTLLTQNNIICKQGYAPEHIDALTDRVIIGNAVSKDNPEVLEVLRRKLPYLSMASAIETYFLEHKQALVVTGTHGKTTTSALLASVLASAGKDPTALIGGWIKNFNSNHRLGDGPLFVIEGDEYDTAFFDKESKFLHYRPQNAILTSIEFDHADIFEDLSAILRTFERFVQLIPQSGILLAEANSREIDQVVQNLRCRVERYGTELDDTTPSHTPDWQARTIKQDEALITFEVWYQNNCLGHIKSPLIGRHNLRNTLAVIALCHHLGLSWPEIQTGLFGFKGVKRRQEIVGIANDIIVMDDFAHHPTAIAETLAALRLRYPTRRLWAVFEPRSATSRRNIFQKAFVQAFKNADHTILAAPFAAEKIPLEERLNPEKIVSELQSFGKTAEFIPSSEKILSTLYQQLKSGDIVCIMSSGGFDGLHTKLLTHLQKACLQTDSV